MRERIFSSVLLPAPLRPMTPMTSPCATSSETSLSAQKCIVGGAALRAVEQRAGAVTALTTESRSER